MTAPPDSVSIVSAATHPQLVEPLESWFLSEWDAVDPLVDPRSAYPLPLFALDTDGELVGGLSFTQHDYRAPIGYATWVNAVLVRPEMRRRGVASLLVEHAEAAAAAKGISTLYAYTEYPGLYTKRGWKVVAPEERSAVVSKELPRTPATT